MFATHCMTRELAPRGGFEPPTFRLTAEHRLNQNLPELALIEGNQLVVMKPDESLSPSLFTFRSHFAAIHHD